MIGAATINLRDIPLPAATADPALEPEGSQPGAEQLRAWLRRRGGEANRELFGWWELAQIALGAAALLVAAFATERSRLLLIGLGSALFLVLFMHLVLSPKLAELAGIMYEETSRAVAARQFFGRLHAGYAVCEAVKLALLGLVGLRLILTPSSRRRLLGKQVDPVDDADHGRLDWRKGASHRRHRAKPFGGE